LDKSGVHGAKGELDGVGVDFLDVLDVGVHTHVREVRELSGVGLTEWIVFVDHSVEGEQYVVSREFTSGLEVRGGVELDAFAQVESVRQAIRGYVPAGGEARNNSGAATFELAQTVEHGFGRSIEVCSGGVLAWIETGRAPFGAEHQVSRRLGERGCGHKASANN